MRIISRKDSQGKTIGYDMVDEDGVVIKSASAGSSPFNNTSARLPGETSVALPAPLEGDFRTPEQKRGDAAALRAEEERASEAGGDSEGGVNIPTNLLNELKGGKGSQKEIKQALSAERPAEGTYGPAFTQNSSYNFHANVDANLEDERSRGGFAGVRAGVAQGFRNVGRGLIDGIEDVADFGAAIIDTARGKEVNDEDNWYNPSAQITDPTSATGNLTKEVFSFGTTTIAGIAAATVALPSSAVAAVSALGGAGLKGNIIRGALSGAVTDFVKAKPAEQNLYNAVAGTPLETPISRFFASDTDEDASYWGTKVKEAIGGIPLGVGFDLLGSSVGKALSKARSEPMMKYLEGIKEVKLLPPGKQEEALRAVEAEVVETAQNTQKLLRAALDEDVKGRITDARRLLKAAEDPTSKGSINIEINEAPIIAGGNSPLSGFTPEQSQRIIEIEENLVQLEDYRKVLNGMRNVDGPEQPLLNEVDGTIFALQDEIDLFDAEYNAPKQVEIDVERPTSPEVADLEAQLKEAQEQGSGWDYLESDTDLVTDPNNVVTTPLKTTSRLPEGVLATETISGETPVKRTYKADVEGSSLEVELEQFKSNSVQATFLVNDSVKAESVSRQLSPEELKQNIKVARKIAKIFQADIADRPDGFIYEGFATTSDGLGASRQRIYQRAGMSEPSSDGALRGSQYGVVVEGKLYPLPDPDEGTKVRVLEIKRDLAAGRAIDVEENELTRLVYEGTERPSYRVSNPRDTGSSPQAPSEFVETPKVTDTRPEAIQRITQAESFELVEDAYEIPVAVFLRETGLPEAEARRLLVNAVGDDVIDMRVRSTERDAIAERFNLTEEEISLAKAVTKDPSRSEGYDTIRVDKQYFDSLSTTAPGSATPVSEVSPGFTELYGVEPEVNTQSFVETPDRAPQAPPQVPEGNRRESLLPTDGPGEVPDRTEELYSNVGVGQREAVGDPSARKPTPLQEPPSVPEGYRRERPVPFRNKAEIRQDVARKAVDKRIEAARANTPDGTEGGLDGPASLRRNKDGSVKGSQRVSKKSKRTAASVGIDLDKLNNKFPAKQSDANVDRFINLNKYGALEDDAIDVVKYVVDHIESKRLLDDLPDPVLKKEGYNFAQAVLHLDKDDAEALAANYVAQTGNLPAARYGIRQIVASMSESVLDVAKQIEPGNKFSQLTIPERTLNEDLAYKISQLSHFVELQKNVGKISGQALRAGGVQLEDAGTIMAKFDFFSKAKEVTPKPDVLRDELSRMLRTPEGRKNFERVVTDLKSAKNFYEAMDAIKVSKFAAMGERASQLIHGVRMNGLLSGTRTQQTNLFANATMALYTPMTQAAGAFIDLGLQRAMGNKVDGAVAKEIAAEAIGMYRGMARNFKDSAILAGRAARAGRGIIDTDQFIDELRLDMLNPNSGSTMYDLALKTLSMPSRGLLFGDEFFKQLNYRANVESKAYQEALKKGLKGKRAKDFVNEKLTSSFVISDDGLKATQGLAYPSESLEYAKYVTFQQEITSDNSFLRHGVLSSLEHLNKKLPGFKHISPFFVPFVKTPLNIVSHMARNTPLGFVSKEFRNDIAAGGARKAKALGEMAMGTSVLLGLTGLGMDGRLVGRAPSDPRERELWYANGNQPYSLKLSDKKSISFQRMEPFAGHMAILADMFTTAARNDAALADEQENMIVAVTMAFITATKDRTFFEGISQLTELITNFGSDDPRDEKQVERATSAIVTSLMPYSSLSNEFRKTRDNTLRETEGIIDDFMNKLPGLSETLPAQRNWLTGEVIQYSSSPMFNLYPTSALKNDPLIDKLLKYNTPISPPDEKIGGIELNKEQYSQMLQLVGQQELNKYGGKTLYQALSAEFDNHNLETLDAELEYLQKNDDYATKTPIYLALSTIRKDYIKAAEATMMQLYPELIEPIRNRKVEEGNTKDAMFWMNSPLYEEVGYQFENEPGVQEALQGNQEDADKSLDKLLNDTGPLSIGE